MSPAAAAAGATRLRTAALAAALLWPAALPFTTSGAEILLGLALALRLAAGAVGARADAPASGGGPTTRALSWLLLAFLALYLASVVTAVDPATARGKVLPLLFRGGLFLLLPWTLPGERGWPWLLRGQAVVALVLLVQALLHLRAGWDRAGTPNLHYNTLAQVAGMISLLLLAGAVLGPGDRRRDRACCAAGSGVAAVVLLLTLSRAAWLGWLSGSLLLLMSARGRRSRPLLALLAAAVAVALLLPGTRDRATELAQTSDPEFARRYDMWRMAGRIIVDHPVLGLGPGGIDTVYDHYKTGMLANDPQRWPHVHNDLLEVALSHGLPAAVLWGALAVAAGAAGRRRRRELAAPEGSWARAAFAGALLSLYLSAVCGLLHDNFVIYQKVTLLLYLLGMLVAADRELGPPRPAGAT